MHSKAKATYLRIRTVLPHPVLSVWFGRSFACSWEIRWETAHGLHSTSDPVNKSLDDPKSLLTREKKL